MSSLHPLLLFHFFFKFWGFFFRYAVACRIPPLYLFLKLMCGTSLVVQQPRLHAPNAGGPRFNPWSGDWIPHKATKSLVSHLRPDAAK